MEYAQAIGFVGYALALWAGLQKNDDRLFLGFSLSSFAFSVHHFMLNNLMGGASMAIIGVRMFLNQYFKGAIIAVPFSILALILAYFTYQDLYSLLPLAAVLTATIGTAYTKGVPLRYVFIFCCTCWLIHDLAKHSYAGTLQDITNIIIHSITIYRIKLGHKKERLEREKRLNIQPE